MQLRRPESSQRDVIWTGYNPELIAIFDPEKGSFEETSFV